MKASKTLLTMAAASYASSYVHGLASAYFFTNNMPRYGSWAEAVSWAGVFFCAMLAMAGAATAEGK